jgi:ethanolamine ammonia-lyase small subunit
MRKATGVKRQKTPKKISATQRLRERGHLHARMRAVLRAWPVHWTEELLQSPPATREARDFVIGGVFDDDLGDTQARFVVRVVYPDENEGVSRPDAIRCHLATEFVKLCQRLLR